ncbi:hypothetical protein ACOYR1_11530 [Thalassotalea piscium]
MALFRRLSFIMLLLSFAGCGGSEGGLSSGGNVGGTGEGETDVISITLALSSEQLPATLTATVLRDGVPLNDTRVSFTIDDSDYGFFTPEKGTVKTDVNGQADITLNPGVSAGTGKVVATLDSGETAELFFNSQGASDVVVRIGSGEPFNNGIATLGQSQISAGATTSISVKLVDEQDNLYKEQVDVNFTSRCAEEAVPSAEIDKVITTSTGEAEANYLAKGCVGDDQITVNAIVDGVNLQATATLNVLPADIGSISFVSATPSTIGIIGTGAVGGSESSTIIFKVLDTNGNPVNNQEVDFSLSTSTGDISLNPLTAQTNNQGLVQTVVNSGSVATTVRVNANVVGSNPRITSQSSVLVISTGIPDQDSFTLAFSNLNPQAWGIANVEVKVTALLADAFNNPAPDGTAVSFTTEGGSIEPSCVTTGGQCTVIWRSQNPSPQGQELSINSVPPRTDNIDSNGFPNFMGQKYGGRVTILATSIGEESFPDLNGNGRFDICEVPAFRGETGFPCKPDGTFDTDKDKITYDGKDVNGRYFDRSEAFSDYNEDGFFNPAQESNFEQAGGDLEEYIEFNGDGIFNEKDGLYNGVLCAENNSAGCSVEQKSINVSAQGVIVMSGSTPYWCIRSSQDGKDPGDNKNYYREIIGTHASGAHLNFCEIKSVSYTKDFDQNPVTVDETIIAQDHNYDDKLIVPIKGTASFSIVMADLHNQPMPSGSTVSFISDIGSILSGPSDWLNTNKNGGDTFGGTFKAGEEAESGSIYFKIEFPNDGGSLTVPILDVIVE